MVAHVPITTVPGSAVASIIALSIFCTGGWICTLVSGAVHEAVSSCVRRNLYSPARGNQSTRYGLVLRPPRLHRHYSVDRANQHARRRDHVQPYRKKTARIRAAHHAVDQHAEEQREAQHVDQPPCVYAYPVLYVEGEGYYGQQVER